MKRILLLGLVIANINAMELVKQNAVSAKDDALKLYTNQKELYVEDENAAYRVEAYEMNKELRDLLKYKALAKFIDSEAGRIRISQLDDGAYTLTSRVHGDGGGVGGAWVGMLTGKFVVHFVAQSGIALATAGVAIVCPPAAVPFAYAAEATVTPFVEAASNVAALGCGIFGAAITGPV